MRMLLKQSTTGSRVMTIRRGAPQWNYQGPADVEPCQLCLPLGQGRLDPAREKLANRIHSLMRHAGACCCLCHPYPRRHPSCSRQRATIPEAIACGRYSSDVKTWDLCRCIQFRRDMLVSGEQYVYIYIHKRQR